ncbi:MAG: epoxyqueuosine reductase [Spirochaetota bacterium]
MNGIAQLDTQHLQKIAESARRLGFARMAALAVDRPSREYRDFHEQFVARALPDDLHYLRRHERFDVTSLLPGAQSVLLFTYPYRFRTVEEKLRNARYKIARYAWQKDYHELLKEKLGRLVAEFSLSGRAVTDSAPFAERYWARRAGLGRIGRNGMLIDRELGSYFLIAALVLNDALQTGTEPETAWPATDIESLCGECRLCVEACPTEALLGDSQMDASRCISFQTIESRVDTAALPEPRRRHNWIFGCDICQQVCPWNKSVSAAEEFNDEHPLAAQIAGGQLPGSRSKLKGSVFHRRGVQKLQQNIAAVERPGPT